jgi:hypothetical protein
MPRNAPASWFLHQWEDSGVKSNDQKGKRGNADNAERFDFIPAPKVSACPSGNGSHR